MMLEEEYSDVTKKTSERIKQYLLEGKQKLIHIGKIPVDVWDIPIN